MARFLRENWLWIVAPIVFALVLFALLFLFMGGENGSEFQYNIW